MDRGCALPNPVEPVWTNQPHGVCSCCDKTPSKYTTPSMPPMPPMPSRRKYLFRSRQEAEDKFKEMDHQAHGQLRLARALYTGSIQSVKSLWHRLGAFDLKTPGGGQTAARPDPQAGALGDGWGRGSRAHWHGGRIAIKSWHAPETRKQRHGGRKEPTIHEVDFCSQIASEANILIRQNPSAYPFRDVRVEGYGQGVGRRKRKDLRFYGANGKVNLCGEVKTAGHARRPLGPSPKVLCKTPRPRPATATPRSATSSPGTSTSSWSSTASSLTGRCSSGASGLGVWGDTWPIPRRWPAKTT